MKKQFQQNFFWRLTLFNILGIAFVIILSSWAIYHTACFLAEGMAGLEGRRQQQFNTTLFHYLLIFTVSGIVVGSFLHIYMTRKIIAPVRQLIQSMRKLGLGAYPDEITSDAKGELGLLIKQYNQMITQLKVHDGQRKKLISDLSHEIRTPLANLQGYLHGLQSGVITGNASLYHSLYEETKRLTNLMEQIDQLKELDHNTSQTFIIKEAFNIADAVEQCVAMFEWALTEKNISIVIDVEPIQLRADQASIQRVLTNLIDNAIRYYQETGTIQICGKTEEDTYKLSISGPGHEIPQDAIPKLFERFYRIDESRSRNSGGTGLGLAIVKEIIEQHGGDVGFIQDGQKNEFWITLPLVS